MRGDLVSVRSDARLDVAPANDNARRRNVVYVLLLTVISCSVYLWFRLHCGFLPEDDGLLGQSALRVLRGQLPHVDYPENYTGGLAYIHAATFELFGVNAFAMRTALFALSIPFLLSVFYIGYRLTGIATAAAVTVLAAVWSVPVYPTPMPSWYNLYFAVFGAAALMRFIESPRKRWLFLAGIAGGISFDIKVVGLYFIAGVLLFLVFREQELSAKSETESPGTFVYSGFVVTALIVFVAAIAKLVGGNLREGDVFQFLLPSAALAGLLVRRELRNSRSTNRKRFSTLFGMALPYLAGCGLPIFLLLIPYILGGNVHSFIHGVFVQGVDRAHELTQIHAELPELGLALPPLVFLLAAKFWRPLGRTFFTISSVAAFSITLALAVWSSHFSEAVFSSASMMTPWVIAFSVGMLASKRIRLLASANRQQIMLVVSLAGLCSLVQFPFPAAVYFCYFSPLLALAIVALVAKAGNPPVAGKAAMALLIFYALFGLVRLVPSNIYRDGTFQPQPAKSTLHLDRAGGIKTENSDEYQAMIRTLQSHARNSYILAAPECPDIYFFSGLENPTNNDGAMPPDQVKAVLAREDVYAAVLNQKPYFSKSIDAAQMLKLYEARFPHSQIFGKYVVMWR